MIPLFIGLSTANILLLSITFGLGLFATDGADHPTDLFAFHITIAIAAGLMATLTHIIVYTYFMATSKWLHAATHKAGLDVAHFVKPAFARKARALGVCMAAIVTTMLTMFAGAASDPTMPILWWPSGLHLVMGVLTLAVNLGGALIQFRLIRKQGALMDEALAILNSNPTTSSPLPMKLGNPS